MTTNNITYWIYVNVTPLLPILVALYLSIYLSRHQKLQEWWNVKSICIFLLFVKLIKTLYRVSPLTLTSPAPECT